MSEIQRIIKEWRDFSTAQMHENGLLAEQLEFTVRVAQEWQARAEAAERRVAELEEGIKAIDKAVDIQCSDGNWNYDPYMHGMANALLLAQTYMAHPIGSYDAEHYKPLSAPERWLSDEPPTPSNSTGLTDSA